MLIRQLFLVLFGLLASSAAPQERKPFHEHLKDFLGLIIAESGLEIEQLLRQYGENEDFAFACTYLRTTNFKQIFQEVQNLPEFKDVVNYMEKAHIDVSYIIERINAEIDLNEKTRHRRRKFAEEMATSSYIRESINLFPKEKLAALFIEKQNESTTFRHSIEKLKTEEWTKLYNDLWESKDFKKAVETLAENGLDVHLLVEQITAIFGQN